MAGTPGRSPFTCPTQARAMVNLRQVQGNGCILLWPPTFPGEPQRRGTKGYVVDLDAPCEREFVAGQEHKLVAAPPDAKPDKIEHPIAIRMQREALAKAERDAASAKLSTATVPASDDDLDESKRASRKAQKAGAA